MICNGVFEGGGVRGIGHVGAAAALEQAGYRFQNLAGTSAGAMVAALLACGYTTKELSDILANLDYRRFAQTGTLSSLGLPGKAASLWFRLGIYYSDGLTSWLSALLAKKGKYTFGDIPAAGPCAPDCRWRLMVTASDVTDQRLLILPRDLAEFGIDPDSFPIALAVRMSVSIPLFYQPVRLKDATGQVHLIVDGGLLSNYPLWLFDDDNCPSPHPTIGFRFVGGEDLSAGSGLGGHPSFWQYLTLLERTALDAADKQHIAEDGGDWARTVAIPVTIQMDGRKTVIRATDFDITPLQSKLLYENGRKAGEKFLGEWSFAHWRQQYRGCHFGSAVDHLEESL